MEAWFANPLLLWLGLLAGPVVALFMLRHKPIVKRVPSTLLWAGAAQLSVATSPFSRLRKSLSLLLMLLLLLCLVLALAGLRIPDARSRGLPLVVIIDCSAGMQTQTPDGTRLDVAISRAQDVINAASDSPITLLKWNGALLLAAPADCEALQAKRALRQIEASDFGASDEALLLALKPYFESKRKQRIVLISDHGPGSVDAEFVFVPAGAPAVNVGIVAADCSQPAKGEADLFFGLELHGEESRRVTVKLELVSQEAKAGSAELTDARDVILRAGRRTPVSFRVSRPGLYRARLDVQDALPADDTALLRVIEPDKLSVVFIGKPPQSLSELVNALDFSTVEFGPQIDLSRCSVVYSEAVKESAPPRLPAVYLGPASAPPGVSFGKPYDASEFAARPARSFLWRGAGVPDIRIGRAGNIETKSYLQPLLEAGSGVAMGILNRVDSTLSDLIVGFDLDYETNSFRAKYAFVIFWTNWFEHVRGMLEPLPRGACRTAESVEVTKLGGRQEFRYGLLGSPDDSLSALPGDVLALDKIGIYRFDGLSDTALPLLGVSLLDPTESNTAAASTETYDAEVVAQRLDQFSEDNETAHADYDLRPWLALLGLALILFDWFWFRRRFPIQAEGPASSRQRRGVTALRKRKAGA